MKYFFYFLSFFLISVTVNGQEFKWPFLDRYAIGAQQFIDKNPEADGRNVLIFVVDNGVDPAIAGLLETSHGKTKVVDMQDFTGQLVLPMNEAEKASIGQENYLICGDCKIKGWEALKHKPADDAYYLFKIDEKEFKNSAVPDLNNNGKTNDSFTILAFRVENASQILKDAPGLIKPSEDEALWAYLIDENADGSVADEKIKFEYKYRYDYFDFHKGDEKSRPLVTMSINFDDKNMNATIVSVDGSHGSHCAGIAAGYKIYGAEGNNGIAPGAYVANMKIGSNVLSGGATTTASMKKAYEYGVKFMEEAGFEYAVFSMSYGIGSEQPGRSEIDIWLDNFARQHPEIIIVKSMGNSGPGINSTGNPAGGNGVFSVGAMIPTSTLKDLYGSARKQNWVTHFSSRGGETGKPDIIAPGAAASTVPAYAHGEAYWGTSMSTPQMAGAAALLMSAAIRDNLKINGWMVARAFRFTGREMKGYNQLDYGGGLADVSKAYEYLKIMAKRKETEEILGYKIETENTFYKDLKGPAAFWRADGYFPESEQKQEVTVSGIFPEDMPKEDQHNFFRSYRLRSDSDWLRTDKSGFYLRGNLTAKFSLLYDHSEMRKPGLYTASVSATPTDNSGGYPDFDVWATVVIPNKFGIENNFEIEEKSISLGIGEIDRFFIDVPAGASGMNLSVMPSGNNYFSMGAYLFGPDGNRLETKYQQDNSDRSGIEINYDKSQIDGGIYEFIQYCHYQAQKTSRYDLRVKFYGLQTCPEEIERFDFPVGDHPKTSVKIINQFGGKLNANVSGSIDGFIVENEISSVGQAVYSKEISVGEDVSRIQIEIDMPIAEFNKMTDVAINIYDQSGKAIISSGMSRKQITINWSPGATGKYTFEIVPGFASKETMAGNWNFTFSEKHFYKKSIGIVSANPSPAIYPGIWQDLEFSMTGKPPVNPDGAMTFGKIEFRERNTNDLIARIPVRLD